MDISRRQILAMGAAGLAPIHMQGARIPKAQFAVHPFVEAHPKAVFIKRTNVPSKTDAAAKLR